MLGFPALTPRLSIERPEAMDFGAILGCGTDPDSIVTCVDLVVNHIRLSPESFRTDAYSIPDVSERVGRLIISTAGLSNSWDEINETEGRV